MNRRFMLKQLFLLITLASAITLLGSMTMQSNRRLQDRNLKYPLYKDTLIANIDDNECVHIEFEKGPKDDGLDLYNDDLVDAMIKLLEQNAMVSEKFWKLTFEETRDLLRYNVTGVKYLFDERKWEDPQLHVPSWKKFYLNINERYMYRYDDSSIDELLNDMATQRPVYVEQNTRGSELKFNFHFAKNVKANVKAMRYEREVETNPNHFPIDEFERHVAEIAAFHLDRLLGFGRVPPTTGRIFNLTDFQQLVPEEMKQFFFISPAGNTCFYGSCEEHCNPKYAFCGHGDTMEFSLMIYVPLLNNHSSYFGMGNPYTVSYGRFGKPDWAVNGNFCVELQHTEPYNQREVLLNLVEIHVFDFLTGNRDRHTIHHFKRFGNASYPILYDNGRGFGRTDIDYLSILTPVRQCCQIKRSTLLKLIKLYRGPQTLAQLMEQSLDADPVKPVLIPKHLNALNRRVMEVLKAVAKCIVEDRRSISEVVFEVDK